MRPLNYRVRELPSGLFIVQNTSGFLGHWWTIRSIDGGVFTWMKKEDAERWAKQEADDYHGTVML